MIVQIEICLTQDSAARRCRMQQGKIELEIVTICVTGKPHDVP
jgi:hypothetical protein